MDREATSRNDPGNVRANEGRRGLTYRLSCYSLPRSLGEYCLHMVSSYLCRLWVDFCWLFFVFFPFWNERGTLFEAACVGDVPHVIYFVALRGMLLSPCCSICVQETTPPHPHTPIGDHLGIRMGTNNAESPMKGMYLFSIPRYGAVLGGGRLYIGAFDELSPLQSAPWGLAIDFEWRYVLNSHLGRPPHGPLPPYHPPNGEILRLGIEFPVLIAIQTSGDTRGR